LAHKSGKPESRRRQPARPQPNERARPRVTTLGYEQRSTQSKPKDAPYGSSPELITISESVGRATLAAIEDALRTERLEAPTDARGAATAVPEPAFIFEISTFVVQGTEVFSKASERARRDFVARRLLHRLPVVSIDDVVRIDVTPGAAPNTVILRVWSRVSVPPP
jgi:hypothetical protein